METYNPELEVIEQRFSDEGGNFAVEYVGKTVRVEGLEVVARKAGVPHIHEFGEQLAVALSTEKETATYGGTRILTFQQWLDGKGDFEGIEL